MSSPNTSARKITAERAGYGIFFATAATVHAALMCSRLDWNKSQLGSLKNVCHM